MIYLACPYSDPDLAVRERRYQAACAATAALLRTGHSVISPIVQGHPLVEYGLPAEWSFWERYDRELLARCDEVLVLMLEGWQQSVGVRAEIQIATEFGTPVWYLTPELADGSPTLAHVAAGAPAVDSPPTRRSGSPRFAHVAWEVPK